MDFTWKGAAASSKGIYVTELPPVQRAMLRDEAHVIPYRSGNLHIQDGSYDELVKQAMCYLPYEQGVTVASLRELRAWLTGRDWVSFSDEPTRKYRAYIINEVDFGQWVTGFEDREFAVFFECEPYAYHTTGAGDITITASGTTITNPGTAEAQPLLAITGSGDATLMAGREIVYLTGLSGTIYLDCEAMEAYTASGVIRTSCNEKMNGEFPTLPPGVSQISWIGNITRVVVTPRWRDI